MKEFLCSKGISETPSIQFRLALVLTLRAIFHSGLVLFFLSETFSLYPLSVFQQTPLAIKPFFALFGQFMLVNLA